MEDEPVLHARIIWHELLKRHRRPFLQFLEEGHRRREALTALADRLTAFLIQSIRSIDDAAAFWRAVPSVLDRCDEQETYEKPFAPEAYAWIHLLDRIRQNMGGS